MANPNSLLTKVRLYLVARLDPMPDGGEAWCVRCTMNGGRTTIIPAAGHQEHAQAHADTLADDIIRIRVKWPDGVRLRGEGRT